MSLHKLYREREGSIRICTATGIQKGSEKRQMLLKSFCLMFFKQVDGAPDQVTHEELSLLLMGETLMQYIELRAVLENYGEGQVICAMNTINAKVVTHSR